MEEKKSKIELFSSKAEITKALESTNSELLFLSLRRLRQQLNVRPNSSDPSESAQATRALAPVYDYVDESKEGEQLFKIWRWQQEHAVAKVEILILEVITKMIHQCNTALHRTVSMKMADTILKQHMTALYRNLSSGRINIIQATLRLLTAMNHVHHSTTKDIKDNFNFGLKVLPKLMNQRRKEGDESTTSSNKPDTRSLYIQFLLAFFIRGDATVKKEVLEIKDLIHSIFKTLHLDPIQLVKQVLNVLLNNVIMDSEISKTLKITFFNNWVLDNIHRLYSRQETVPPLDQSVAQVGHEFLKAICTVPGVGVCFQDAAWYPPSMVASAASSSTSEKSSKPVKLFNRTLSRFIHTLRPTEDLLQQDLTLSILKACPELVRPYWQHANLYLDPRLSAKWLANMSLLHKTTALPVPNLYIQSTGLFASYPPPVATIIENILPSAANRTLLSKGLQHTSMLVRYYTIVELAAAFQKAEQVVAVMNTAVQTLAYESEDTDVHLPETVEQGEDQEKSTDPPHQQWSNAIKLLLAEIRRRMPDIQIIISLHNTLQGPLSDDNDQEESTRRNLLNNGVLRLIKYYQQFLPQAVMESKFDIGKLIPASFETVQAGSLIHLLELLLELKDFRWSNKSADGTCSHLTKLLRLYLMTSHIQIRILTRRLVSKLLGESILFQHDPSEAFIWIDSIPTFNYGSQTLTAEQNHLLHFLDECIVRCLRVPYKYVDQATRLIKNVQDPIAGADTFASKLETSAFQDSTLHSSPLLMTFLEQFQHVYAKAASKDAAVAVAAFLYRLMPTLALNQNRTPAATIDGLKTISALAESSVNKVVNQSLTLRNGFGSLGVVEWIGMTMVRLQGALLVTLPSPNSKGQNATSLLESSTREELVHLLGESSVSMVQGHISELTTVALRLTGSVACVVAFIQNRHPYSGSVFEYREIKEFIQHPSRHSVNDNPIHLLLQSLPFATLFDNTTPALLSNAEVIRRLKSSLSHSSLDQIALAVNQILLKMSVWLEDKAAKSAVQECFGLLNHLLDIALEKTDAIGFETLKTRLLGHYVSQELYLTNGATNRAHVLDDANKSLALLVMRTSLTQKLGRKSWTSAEQAVTEKYVMRTVERVLHELNMMTSENSKEALSAETAGLFGIVAPLCRTLDLSALLQSLLDLHHHPTFTTTLAFNNLLSFILKELARHNGSTAAVSLDSISSLLNLWKQQPSPELDAVVADVICSRLEPNALAKTFGPIDLAKANVFDQIEAGIHAALPAMLNLDLVAFILDKPNPDRVTILAALLTARSDFRQEFVAKVLSMYAKGQQTDLISENVMILLHAYTQRIASFTDSGACDWSPTADEFDKRSIIKMNAAFTSRLVSSIARSPASTHSTVQASQIAGILLSLSACNQEDEANAWVLLNSISHLGMDTVQLFGSILKLNLHVDIQNDDADSERQDRVAKWFELTAHRLVYVLDEQGDAEWLDSVSKELLNYLEINVVAQQLTIDQKILFELVSFTIEKALDNVNLVRFASCLANKYFETSSQPSVLTQILQTLYKHGQFESLVKTSPPMAKYTRPENESTRLAIVQLIHTITFLDPTGCCRSGFVPMLLSCYSASTSKADQLLLALIKLHESHAGESVSGRAPLWGEAANSKVTSSLAGQALISESLDLLDPIMMMTSIVHFPHDRPLEADVPTIGQRDFEDAPRVWKALPAPIFDPCFLLPLFATYLSHGAEVDCRRMIEVNGLGYLIVALSSTDEHVRLAAYSILDEFYLAMQHVKMRERNQVLLLLDSLKNSIVDRGDSVPAVPAQRLPFVITIFVAQGLSTLLRPDHFMYPHINKFCLQRPMIDLEDIPIFFGLFNSSSENHRKERAWLLRLLSASLKTPEDYRLFKRRHALDLATGFYNSQLSDPIAKKIVVEMLFNASSVPNVALQMMTQSSALSWIHSLAVLTPTTHDNEFSLVAARLLLRFVQSCPKESIRWMNGVWVNQVVVIGTTLLQQLSTCTVVAANVRWTLSLLESVLAIFSYAVNSLDSNITSLSDTTSQHCRRLLGSRHGELIMTIMQKCEQVLVIESDHKQLPITKQASALTNLPARNDPVEILYDVTEVAMLTHASISRILVSLVSTGQLGDNNNKSNAAGQGHVAVEDFVRARALGYQIV